MPAGRPPGWQLLRSRLPDERRRAGELGRIPAAAAAATDGPSRAVTLFFAALRVCTPPAGLEADAAPARFLRAIGTARAPGAAVREPIDADERGRTRQQAGAVDAGLPRGAIATASAGLGAGLPPAQSQQGSERACHQPAEHPPP